MEFNIDKQIKALLKKKNYLINYSYTIYSTFTNQFSTLHDWDKARDIQRECRIEIDEIDNLIEELIKKDKYEFN